MDITNTPFLFVLIALIAYAVAYFWYGKWFDRTVWKSDANKTTPAHMYLDGVEYFPVSKYVLWGYQFKSVAALGPILGPFIAIQYGWLPALLWIVFGNFFIGWLQDYGSVMVSVRNQGKSFGPISYEFTGAGGRNTLLWFVLLYLLIISATFIYFIAIFWNIFPGVFWATLGVFVAGVVAGRLIYRVRMNILAVSGIALAIVFASLYLATLFPQPAKDFLGVWSLPFWAVVCLVFLYLGAILPLPTFIQPVNFVAFFPAFGAVILIIVGALLSPVTNTPLTQQAFKTFFPSENIGPLWPMMFVAIACGAISGWHSLVGSSSTAKQLDIETDAHPVGAGAMLSEGLLGLASLAAYMIVAPDIIAQGNVGAWVFGATKFTAGYLPFLGDVGLRAFFGMALVIFAITVQALVTRFWRLVAAEVTSGTSVAWFGHKQIATVVGLVIAWTLAVTGSWINLWLYFGGANQLVAALALWLISIHFARVKSPSRYTLIPAVFMTITTLAALAYQTLVFTRAGLGMFGITLFKISDKGIELFLSGAAAPLVQAGQWIALPENRTIAYIFNLTFALVGLALFLLGIRMSMYVWGAYRRFSAGPAPTPAPSPRPAEGGD